MENKLFYELVNIEKINKLVSNWDTLEQQLNIEFNTTEKRKTKNYQKKLLYTILKNYKNELSVDYNFGSGRIDGRLYGKGLQGLKRALREIICGEFYTDIDLKNSQPKILQEWCKKYKLKVEYIDEYCNNREMYYHLKQPILEIIFGGKTPCMESQNDVNFMLGIEQDTVAIHNLMMNHKDYQIKIKQIKNKKKKKYNDSGTLCAYILEQYESVILKKVLLFLDERGIPLKYIVMIFDGFMLPNEHYTPELLVDINEYIFKVVILDLIIPATFLVKPMNPIDITKMTVLDAVALKKETELAFYKITKTTFEKKFQKIIDAGVFLSFENNEINYFTENKLKVGYKHYAGKFIDHWLTDPYMKTYDNIGVYPKNCPKNIFNLWLPFDAELNDLVGDDNDAVEFFKSHIHIICNHEQEITTLIINWLAQMLQYPELKTFIPVFISKQGAGKGTIFEIMSKILGTNRVFDTATPSQFVWGAFNGAMEQGYFIYLDELSKKEVGECEGRFKKLATDGKVRINKKGIESFDIKSYHRFMISSNNDDPIRTSEDDRRNMIIKCSDELCDKEKNKDYWIKMRKIINDPNAIKSIYNYFMSIPDLEYFNVVKLPRTEYHKDILEKNEPAELSFVKHLAEKNTLETVCYNSSKIIEMFNDFIKSIGKKDYNIDAPTLLLRLKNLNINGVSKKKTKIGNLTEINFKLLKEHFEIEIECEITFPVD